MARITSVAMMLTAMAAAQVAAFPVEAELRNSSWRNAVEPETGAELAGESVGCAVTILNADQLQRVLSNIEQLNTVAMWPEGVGLSLHFGPDGEVQGEDPAVSSAVAARKAEAEQQKQADADALAAQEAATLAAKNAEKEAAEAAAAAGAAAEAAQDAANATAAAAAAAAAGKAAKAK